nr:cytoskeleton protein RodZ [uncultured Moellerella sp.]
MNNESNPELKQLTVGQLLSQSREQLGITQEMVAARLCLKVTVVREIEEDIKPAGVEPTFLRGYMRLYARMVNIPEADLLTLLNKEAPMQVSNVSPMQSYSLGKRRKKRDGWLMKITWLIVIILVTMVGVWWWQDNQAQQKELVSMAEQNGRMISQQEDNNSDTPADASSVDASANETTGTPLDNLTEGAAANNTNTENSAQTTPNSPSANENVRTVPLPGSQVLPASIDRSQNSAATEQATPISDALVMSFKGDCWLEVRDGKNKVLYSGIKKRGESLELQGQSVYNLNIGVPANVDIKFKGNNVDLSRFIKANRAAKFKLPEA